MTLKILLNIFQTNFHSGETFELLLKNKKYNKIKLEMQDERVHQSTQWLLLSCSLQCRWMSYELLMYIQIRVCVCWLRRVVLLYGFRKGHELQPLHQAKSNPMERGQLCLFP